MCSSDLPILTGANGAREGEVAVHDRQPRGGSEGPEIFGPVGVVGPMALGFVVMEVLGESANTSLFLGAALAAGPIRPGIRARYRDGIFFVGNAAGEAHPIVAEGIGMGMQSAWLLARILSSYESPVTVTRACEGAGRTYSRQWRTAFAPRIRAASFFAHLALSPAATSTALHVLQRFPALITWGARLSGKASQLVPA